ncbi:MAG: hypothetical protein QMD86_02350 [Patescibacteria group bacterium]|nr:hypothetical protein [Patescibacteria group bacterium]
MAESGCVGCIPYKTALACGTTALSDGILTRMPVEERGFWLEFLELANEEIYPGKKNKTRVKSIPQRNYGKCIKKPSKNTMAKKFAKSINCGEYSHLNNLRKSEKRPAALRDWSFILLLPQFVQKYSVRF